MSDLADLLKDFDDRDLTAVATPEWPPLDGKLFARRLSAEQRLLLSAAVSDKKATDGSAFVISVVIAGTVNDAGECVFSDPDREWLGKKSAEAIGRLFAAIDELNCLSSYQRGIVEKNSDPPGD
jgi:hypothetical protein